MCTYLHKAGCSVWTCWYRIVENGDTLVQQFAGSVEWQIVTATPFEHGVSWRKA